MFEEQLIIMRRLDQQSPTGGIVVSWFDGETITGKLQISNMLNVQIAQAQGVRSTGFLAVKNDIAKKITLDTYLRFPKGGYYVRVADAGVVEAGDGVYQERQYSVEVVAELPR